MPDKAPQGRRAGHYLGLEVYALLPGPLKMRVRHRGARFDRESGAVECALDRVG